MMKKSMFITDSIIAERSQEWTPHLLITDMKNNDGNTTS